MAGGKKTGGRTKGVPNKTTAELRGVFKTILEAQTDKLTIELEALEGKDYIIAYCKLAEFVIPKKMEVSGDDEKPIVVSVKLQINDLYSDPLT